MIGSRHPVVVQSMTNTDTADADATALQVAALAHAGSELVRVTVNNDAAARAVPEIRRKLDDLGVGVPIIGDFHYNGHQLLIEYPEMAAALAKYRINPGNVGAKRHDENFQTIVRVAIEYDKPVRIGVNWGSLDQALLTELMDANARAAEPADSRDVMIEAMVQSALRSAELAEETGLGPRPDHHQRQGLAGARPRRRLPPAGGALRLPAAPWPDRGRHGHEGHRRLDRRPVDPAAHEGIGDTIRVSLTPAPGGDRTEEVLVAQQVLQSLGLRSFMPQVSACPGCGRTTTTFFQEMAEQHPGLPARADAGLGGALSGCRGDARRGHGLRRQRPGRVQARRHRHLAAGHVRGAGGARSSSTARCARRCAARAWSRSSSRSSTTTSRSRYGNAGAAA